MPKPYFGGSVYPYNGSVNLSDMYKYPENPMVNSRVDRLEDRIARQERNLSAGVSSVQTLDMESAYPTAVVAMASSPSSNDEKVGYDMDQTEEVPMYDAGVYSKYVGQIVHDSYEDCLRRSNRRS